MALRRWLVLPALLAGLSACGAQAGSAATSAAPSATRSPHDIILKLYTSGLRDAHFTMTEQLPDGSGGTVQGIGDGLFVTKPPAESQSVQIDIGGGSSIIVQSMAIGNTIYHKKSTDATWTASPGRSALANLDRSYELKLTGDETTPQGRAWHLSGTDILGNPFEIWIREKDGYPLKYTSHHAGDATAVTTLFDRYNTGQTISAPPPAQVVQGG
jgi:hypothetical protein